MILKKKFSDGAQIGFRSVSDGIYKRVWRGLGRVRKVFKNSYMVSRKV